MSWELVTIFGLVLVLAFFVWRELRKSAPKGTKALKSRLAVLEQTIANLPTTAQLDELAEKVEGATPVKVKPLVDRANELSTDMIEVKRRLLELEQRFKAVEFAAKLKGILTPGMRDGG